jgi:hypothetical protein
MPTSGVSFLIRPNQTGGPTVVSELTEPLMSAIVPTCHSPFALQRRVALKLRDNA